MNRNRLKAYAPKARRDFIKAVTDRAAVYGLTKSRIEPVIAQGDVAVIGGKAFPKEVAEKRGRLEERIRREGFEQVMEAVAYTWFNRFAAIRFMEVHGYLDHGYRVLSTTNNTPVEHPHVPSSGATGQANRDPSEIRYAETLSISRGKPGSTGRANSTNEKNAGLPEIVGYAEHVALPGVDRERAVELKLAGNRDEELYRMLLVGQCNALNRAMPFLFERIGDALELLLPENLLHSDSLIRRMVNEIPEEGWEEVEIIGWLYQFYISEKKDQVIGKVVKSEDIPAATQLFTPNWIVKYMVQNTIGRMWLATYPNSPLENLMEYYIEPGEQTPEVEEQIRAITPKTLNPEEMTLADVACGSGHILVEGYDLFKAIYQERGYRAKDIPRLILEKNLYGLDIDDRAAQLAAFALMMKARADDRRIFERGIKLNVLAIQNSPELSDEALEVLTTNYTNDTNGGQEGVSVGLGDLRGLLELFEHGKTFGSLIRVPEELGAKLPQIAKRVEDVLEHGEMFGKATAEAFIPIIEQLQLLGRKYNCVVTNPPYMGGKGMDVTLGIWLKFNYTDVRSDLFSAFIVRNTELAIANGTLGFVTPYVWLFLSSYEKLRQYLLKKSSITTLIQLEYNAFEPACIPACSFTLNNSESDILGNYIRLSKFRGYEAQKIRTLMAISDPNCGWHYHAKSSDFSGIFGTPVAYWISDKLRQLFISEKKVEHFADSKQGLATADNARFLRLWHEVSLLNTGIIFLNRNPHRETNSKWIPHQKGGTFRRWYGNNEYLVNWQNNGEEIRKFGTEVGGRPRSRVQNSEYYFLEGITWSDLTISKFAGRYFSPGYIFDITGPAIFPKKSSSILQLSSYVNSSIFQKFLDVSLSGMHYSNGVIASMPCLVSNPEIAKTEPFSKRAIALSKEDWDSFENSWDFTTSPLLRPEHGKPMMQIAYFQLRTHWREIELGMQRLEEQNNRIFIEAYGLQDELTPDVPLSEITLTCNPHYRYGPGKSEEELEELLRADTMKELVSYAVGCMMGRYSLDAPGLIYAHSGNDQFWEIYHQKHNQPPPPQTQNHSCNSCDSWLKFPPDGDGIIPITDTDWFPDDAGNRFIRFISTAWPKEHLEENLQFIADSLSPNRSESPRETIRRYMATGFFKHHLKMYKKRPIYWLFSSGKLRAFQCLVYLHRYNEGTLSRMRTEYVIPLQGKISARIEQLAGDILAATSTAHSKKLERERSSLIKQQAELQTFDEKLRHYADMRIALDLDDGVKVNYGKFGDLLAEVDAITGKK